MPGVSPRESYEWLANPTTPLTKPSSEKKEKQGCLIAGVKEGESDGMVNKPLHPPEV